MRYTLLSLFNINGQVAVVTGGGGVLCSEMAVALAELGARVAVLSLHQEKADKTADAVRQRGGEAVGIACDATDVGALAKARDSVVSKFGGVDILVNGAGGNQKAATTGGVNAADAASPTFWELSSDAVRKVFDLNFLGTLLAAQVFGQEMARRRRGVIINITSMNAYRPLTKIAAYAAAKAAVANLTQWLAVHFAPLNIRVNAIAPGFFLPEQNRFLLTDEKTGEPTPRGKAILAHTPMQRYGEPSDLIGALVYLASPASSFVTGTTVAVDGGFSAFSGV